MNLRFLLSFIASPGVSGGSGVFFPGRARRRRAALSGRAGVFLGALLAGTAGGALQAQPIAEGGSPLYLIAVRESILGLKGGKTPPRAAPARAPARSRAASSAGNARRMAITPEFLRRYYYCTNCHAWHLRAQPLPAPAGKGATNVPPRAGVRPGSPPAATNQFSRPPPRPAPAPASRPPASRQPAAGAGTGSR
jgi:hypothetical protein